MSRYGVTVFGTDYYGEVVDNAFDSTPFVAVATSYTDVSVTWRLPGGSWSRLRLVRNSNGVPISVNDGTTLLDEAYSTAPLNSRFFGDTGLTSGRFYYYALFVLDSLGVWRATGSDEVLVTKDYGYRGRLFDRLPEVFKTGSTEQIGSGVLAGTDSFLNRFLSVFGNELDYLRTEYEALRHALDARTISAKLLPALSRQVGMPYEPQLGARAQRRLVANAVHLYGLKGTLPGTRELATIVTGWDCGVRIGRNLALDDLDAGNKGSEGRWRGADGSAKVTWSARHGSAAMPVDASGYLDITATGGRVDAVLNMDRSDGDPLQAKQYAVPIVQGRTYTTSMYAAGPRDDSSIAVRMRVTWLDVQGRSLGYDIDGDDQIISTLYTARPFLTLTAPVGARYLQAALVYTSQSGYLAVREKLRACGFMVDEYDGLRPWQCAREIIVQLRAEHINEMIYPTPDPDATTSPWMSNAGDDDVTTIDGVVFFRSTVTGSAKANIDTFPGDYRVQHQVGAGYSLSAEGAPSSFLAVAYDLDGTPTVHVIPATAGAAVAPADLFPSSTVTIAFGLRFAGPYDIGGAVTYRSISVVYSNVAVDYFDGSTSSTTYDDLWEGSQYASRSYHYTQRTVRTQRLRALLKDFLPNGSCYQLEFAQPEQLLYASPAAVEGVDVSTGTPPPPPPVGRGLELQWNTVGNNTADLTLSWQVQTLKATSDMSLRWNTAGRVTSDLTMRFNDADLGGTVGANLDLLWNELQTSSYGAAPATDFTSAGWTGTPTSTDRWTVSNVSDTNYVYPGFGPVHQTGTYTEVGTDGVSRLGTWAIPNVGENIELLVQAPSGARSAVRDVTFIGAFGETIYHWYNRSADFRTPRLLALIWKVASLVHRDMTDIYNVADPSGYAGAYAGGY